MRPPASRPKIDAIMMIDPPPRCCMCGTARRDARTGRHQRLIERLLPELVRGVDEAPPPRRANVVDEDIDPTERLDRPVDHRPIPPRD